MASLWESGLAWASTGSARLQSVLRGRGRAGGAGRPGETGNPSSPRVSPRALRRAGAEPSILGTTRVPACPPRSVPHAGPPVRWVQESTRGLEASPADLSLAVASWPLPALFPLPCHPPMGYWPPSLSAHPEGTPGWDKDGLGESDTPGFTLLCSSPARRLRQSRWALWPQVPCP